MLSSICAFAFATIRWAASGAQKSENSQTAITNEKKKVVVGKSEAVAEESQAVALKTEKRGFPLLNLRDGKKLQTKYVGANGAEQSLGAAQSQPLTMTNADLNADGAADLVVGYASGDGKSTFTLPNFEGSAPTHQGVFPPRS